MIKRLGKSWLSSVFEWQVRRLRDKYQFQVVAVAGSVGKTSVKTAVANSLSQARRVRYQTGNYNDRLTVPLIFFGQTEPAIFNILAWLRLLIANERQISRGFPYDFVVVELGTDGPGQIAEFAYLQPDIGVVTAVAEEHMEFFGDLDAVAREELTLAKFAKQIIVSSDDVAQKYLSSLNCKTYGCNPADAYQLLSREQNGLREQKLELSLAGQVITAETQLSGLQGAKTCLAAAAVALELGLNQTEVLAAIAQLQPVAGRMQILNGLNGSLIIDDTYNASPLAVTAALDVLYASVAVQKIAILGSMNELGANSPQLHRQIGEYCDPAQVDLVVTIGSDAERYLAPAAAKAGCRVQSFISPYEAGRAVAAVLKPETVILAKGSQNGVFAEEAVKLLLENPSDALKLVRQSAHWQAIKQQQFPQI